MADLLLLQRMNIDGSPQGIFFESCAFFARIIVCPKSKARKEKEKSTPPPHIGTSNRAPQPCLNPAPRGPL